MSDLHVARRRPRTGTSSRRRWSVVALLGALVVTACSTGSDDPGVDELGAVPAQLGVSPGEITEVTGWDGESRRAAVLGVAQRSDHADSLLALLVEGPILGGAIECIVVVSADAFDLGEGLTWDESEWAGGGWIESCGGTDEEPFDRVFRVDDTVWAVRPVGDERLVQLADGTGFPDNGCETPILEALVAIDAAVGPGMVSAVACDGRDRTETVTAVRPTIALSPGPIDGVLLVLERDTDGLLVLVDAGTGIEPDPWPLPITLAPPDDQG